MVVIDGIEYSPTFFDDKVAPGEHTLKLSKPLYYSVIKEIERGCKIICVNGQTGS